MRRKMMEHLLSLRVPPLRLVMVRQYALVEAREHYDYEAACAQRPGESCTNWD